MDHLNMLTSSDCNSIITSPNSFPTTIGGNNIMSTTNSSLSSSNNSINTTLSCNATLYQGITNNISATNLTGQNQTMTQISKTGHNNRKLQVVAVIDRKEPKFSKVIQIVCSEIQQVTELLHTNLEFIEFDRLDFRETSALDLFYNADIAVVDVTQPNQQPSLSYHIGVRESMGQTYNIIISNHSIAFNDRCVLDALKQNLAHTTYLGYVLNNDGETLDCIEKTAKNENITTKIDNELIYLRNSNTIIKTNKRSPFKERLTIALKNVQVEANAHAREKFLIDLRKVRDIENINDQVAFLDSMRQRLDHPDVLSVDTLHQYLLSYRDTENYIGMISLIDDLLKIGQHQIVDSQAVKFLYAFALNRRNKDGDRDKALKCVLEIVDNNSNNVFPDVICLAGRIHKDKFISSNYEDVENLEKAIEWYRKAFEISPLEHSGVNLATLLRAKGEQFDNNSEMQRIAVVLNSLLGRKGTLQTLTDYWDVATFFEVSVLAENYDKACQAALKMAMIKPPIWFLKSTMENIKLINRCAASISPIEKEKQTFLFWTEFFMEAIENTKPYENDIECLRVPVLIQEVNKQYTPSYLSINLKEGSVILFHVRENAPSTIKNTISRWQFSSSQIKAVSSSKRDDRSMYLYVHENSDDFNLVFPNAEICTKIIAMISHLDCDVDKVLPDVEESTHIEFEYERNNNNERILLGKGTYGKVFQARDLRTQCSIAVKEIEVKNDDEVQPLMEEIQLHSTLSHRNIVRYLGSKFVHDEATNSKVFLIFMEQVPGGSLSSLLRVKWGPLDKECLLVKYGSQILEGINYLHEQKIVHRDIKGDNVLVNTYSGVCKISDFGTCKRLAGINPVTDTFKGTSQYMAPEVINHGHRGYGAPADIWSFGCTMVEMATGKPPFQELGIPEAALFRVGQYKTHPIIPNLSEKAKKFIKICFNPNPQERPTAKALLQDPFIQQHLRNSRKTSNKKIQQQTQKPKDLYRSTSHLDGLNTSSIEEYTSPLATTEKFQEQRRSTSSCRLNSAKKNHAIKIKIKPDSSTSFPSLSSTNPSNDCTSSNSTLLNTQIQTKTMSPTFLSNNNILSQSSTKLNSSGTHQGIFFHNHLNTNGQSPNSNIESGGNSITLNKSPITTSPSVNDNSLSPYPITGLSYSDEHNSTNRFFLLQKDSERRVYLSDFMEKHDTEIIKKWRANLNVLSEGDTSPTVDENNEFFKNILLIICNYVKTKNLQELNENIAIIKEKYKLYDDTVTEISSILNNLQGALQKTIKNYDIKPHWIFNLDEVITNAIRTTLSTLYSHLQMECTSENCYPSQEKKRRLDSSHRHSTESHCYSPEVYIKNSGDDDSDRRFGFNEVSKLEAENGRLYAKLITLEKETSDFFKVLINNRETFLTKVKDIHPTDNGQEEHLLIQTKKEENIDNKSCYDNDTKILINWLHDLGCNEISIHRILMQNYTKSDLIQYVTREELLKIGVLGGCSCKIWREIVRLRNEPSCKTFL
ncbi:Mitogen-activated protein kinase kinase kinase 5 [Strongyloides ratti]|uniref:mitogen-activated protein kinase kinase kinase n=1 Tax=Strongyloides ratti TaxID=34506 RepID=A0A090LSG9_STRRB|nr:Mitogen-activated protein kinase kinase kinase 5 [Strongyloides ratti]CEF71157.1 Mitogen-activated protein kinase kinase kinase 5 [Strongyloides ratti]